MSPGRLSYWEKVEVKRKIDVLVDLGKMKPSNFEYACHVTLPKGMGVGASMEIIDHSTCKLAGTRFQCLLLMM